MFDLKYANSRHIQGSASNLKIKPVNLNNLFSKMITT